MDLTKLEAMTALGYGISIRHITFNEDEHITLNGFEEWVKDRKGPKGLVDADGNILDYEEFWKFRQKETFDNGWSVVKHAPKPFKPTPKVPYDYLEDEGKDMINQLIRVLSAKYVNKGDLIDLAYGKEASGKVDTALPIGYVKRIEDILPTFNRHDYCMSYIGNNFGQVENMAVKILDKIHNQIKY